MHVNGDEGLKLGTIHLGQLRGGHLNQLVQEVQELLVGRRHHLLVCAGVLQRALSVARPDHLDTEQAHLRREHVLKLKQFKGGVLDGDGSGADDAVDGAVRQTQQVAQPRLYVTLWDEKG